MSGGELDFEIQHEFECESTKEGKKCESQPVRPSQP